MQLLMSIFDVANVENELLICMNGHGNDDTTVCFDACWAAGFVAECLGSWACIHGYWWKKHLGAVLGLR